MVDVLCDKWLVSAHAQPLNHLLCLQAAVGEHVERAGSHVSRHATASGRRHDVAGAANRCAVGDWQQCTANDAQCDADT